MPLALQLWNRVSAALKSSPRQPPSAITIARDHIDENLGGALNYSFREGQHYFQVLVNEMYLTDSRRWFTQIDPVIYAVAEFTYAGKPEIAPFLVGPNLLKEKGVPDQYGKQGMILRNTRVSGLHPYRGGGLTLTIVLCEAPVGNAIRSLLRVIEGTAGALDFSPVLAPYTKVASVLMDGFDALLGSTGVTPLAGFRDSFGPNYNIPFRPAYFALVDEPDVDPAELWVCNKQLMKGATLGTAKPYRDSDFVLYSIAGTADNLRDDTETLPFNALWDGVKKEAASPVDDPNYKNAKIQMITLYQNIVLSPDLTEPHADALADQYRGRMESIHKRAVAMGMMGPGDHEDTREARARARALSLVS